MKDKKILKKLEEDLSHFLINEISQGDPNIKTSSALFKYRNLSIKFDEEFCDEEKIVKIKIGDSESEFKIEDTIKCSGGFDPMDERLINMWLAKVSNKQSLLEAFKNGEGKKETLKIIPFDLEDVYENEENL